MKPNYIIIHHEGASNGFYVVNSYHKQRWNFKSSLGFYIGYQYYIDTSGKVLQGRADTEEGAHTKGMNSGTIGICLQGNFNVQKPSFAQMTALKALVKRKMNEYAIPFNNIGGHRQFRDTSCPGLNLPNSEIKKLFEVDLGYLQKLLNSLFKQLQAMFARLSLGSKGDLEKDEEYE